MIPRIPVDDNDEDEVSRTPFWRRPRVLGASAIAVIILAYLVSSGHDRQKRPASHKAEDTFIGEVVAYQPAIKPAAAAPAKEASQPPSPQPEPTPSTAPPPPPPPPPPAPSPDRMGPPAAPSPRDLLPKGFQPQQQQTHTRMLVYAVPPPPPPVAPKAPDPATDVDFKTSAIPGLKASAAIDDTYQLMPGLLPMILDTAINSDVPGPILAHLPGPVYSTRGVLLMGAGTQIIGRYESMGKGNRLKAESLYAHVPTAKGQIWVPLTAQGMSDDLGQSGLPGNVDHHYLERFGFATLLTLTDQALQVVQAAVSHGGNAYINLNSGGGVSSLAQQVFQTQVNRPDTFSKNQGETIALFLDQPIDFSASYRITPVKE